MMTYSEIAVFTSFIETDKGAVSFHLRSQEVKLIVTNKSNKMEVEYV